VTRWLLDTFCGIGGASAGYRRAGFAVVGIDNRPQPHYAGDLFIRADAREVLENLAVWEQRLQLRFIAVHASPPCQAHAARRTRERRMHPRLIHSTRRRLQQIGLPYVIENVPGAPLLHPVRYCGSSFRLRVRRHRLFECSFPVTAPPCDHAWQGERFVTVTGGGHNPASFGRDKRRGGADRKPRSREEAAVALGIDWPATRNELNDAIPPAFTAHIGEQLLVHLAAQGATLVGA
jgi:DNA (cytosine-5)-methyltransferase 1